MNRLKEILWVCAAFITVFGSGCANKGKPIDTDIVVPVDTTTHNQGPQLAENELYTWSVDFDTRTKKKNPVLPTTAFGADDIIRGLNAQFPEIKLEEVKMGGDTLYTEIKDSEYLGERMGTSGSAEYIAQAVINLTSVPGIVYVKISFGKHSHASPGTWRKEDFADYKEVE